MGSTSFQFRMFIIKYLASKNFIRMFGIVLATIQISFQHSYSTFVSCFILYNHSSKWQWPCNIIFIITFQSTSELFSTTLVVKLSSKYSPKNSVHTDMVTRQYLLVKPTAGLVSLTLQREPPVIRTSSLPGDHDQTNNDHFWPLSRDRHFPVCVNCGRDY